MPRDPFTVSIPAVWSATRSNGAPLSNGVATDAFFSTEACSGVKRHKPTGWIAPTSYSMSYRSYRRAQGVCKNVPLGSPSIAGQIYTGVVGASRFNSLDHFNGAMLETQITDSTLSNQALLRARLKMKKADVNLGVAFAERNATARLLGDTAARIARSFNKLKRGQVRAAMRELGIANSHGQPRGFNVPNKWLEMQYGWKPLLSDVYGACDALSRRDRSDWRVTAKAQATSRKEGRIVFSSFDAGVCVARADTGAFCRIDALPENDLTMSLSSLGITNPLLIAWELVPYSFVVDWALPVGTWLESIDAMLGYANSSSSISVFTKAVWNDVGRTLPPSGGFQVSNEYSGSKTVVKLVRSASNGVPMPTFPRIKDPLSLGHMANGLSLLSSAFSRR